MGEAVSNIGMEYMDAEVVVLVFQEGESYIAFCPALNLSTYGDSMGDVKEAFLDILTSYLEDGAKMGTLEKDLVAHGWSLHVREKSAIPPKEISLNDLNIPAGMLRRQFHAPFQIPANLC